MPLSLIVPSLLYVVATIGLKSTEGGVEREARDLRLWKYGHCHYFDKFGPGSRKTIQYNTIVVSDRVIGHLNLVDIRVQPHSVNVLRTQMSSSLNMTNVPNATRDQSSDTGNVPLPLPSGHKIYVSMIQYGANNCRSQNRKPTWSTLI